MIKCDLCGEMVSSGAKRYTASQVRNAVSSGLRPPQTLFGSLMGVSQEDHSGWVNMVMADTTDWSVCPSCASRIERSMR